MKILNDFKPIEYLDLPGLGEIDCSGLILIVGPNSSGKSQLLKDIYNRVLGEQRELVVAKKIDVRKPEFDTFLDCLNREGCIITSINQQTSQEIIRPMKSNSGINQAATEISLDQARTWHTNFMPPDTLITGGRNDFLSYFGKMLMTALFLDVRLYSSNTVAMFDYATQSPQNDLHALYINDEARNQLLREISEKFSKWVWPDGTRMSMMSLRVSDDNLSAEERYSPQINQNLRSIENEGDGLKCYVTTCIALLLGRRPICLIDEPEMCLHPPQAYNLGRFIGKFGDAPERVTYVATHSSHVLRGVLQSAPQKLQIIRLKRNSGNFQAHLVSAEILKQFISKPTVLAESILDGIFSQAVIVVEADGDRILYQAVWETLSKQYQLDIHFAAVSGTGGIADACNLYKNLKIPVAVIADLDIVANSGHFNQVITTLVSSDAQKEDLVIKAKEIAIAIKNLPPCISVEDVKSEINDAINIGMDWANGDDEILQKKLNGIANKLKKMRVLKKGMNGLPENIKEMLEILLVDLKNIGLLLVPIGELEDWLANENIDTSKSKKSAWATAAATLVRQKGASEGDIWDFMKEVADYLKKDDICFSERGK
jgi:energy-coupling factor transporter ATP-binding protein EcfA2